MPDLGNMSAFHNKLTLKGTLLGLFNTQIGFFKKKVDF